MPVGVPKLLVTVAVKVTDCPKTEGFADELTVVVVEALLTVTVGDAAIAVSVPPACSVFVVNVAVPPVLGAVTLLLPPP